MHQFNQPLATLPIDENERADLARVPAIFESASKTKGAPRDNLRQTV